MDHGRYVLNVAVRISVLTSVPDYMASSHHGRGIMSKAIGTLIREWMVPRMNAKHMRTEAFVGNAASVRVFEKNGFVLEGTTKIERVTSAGVKHEGMHALTWELEKAHT